MPARRSRSRKGARRRVRRHAVARIPRAKTAVVNCVFEQEQVYGAVLGPGNTTFNSYNTIVGNLPGYVVNGSGNQAVMYAFSFAPSWLNSSGVGNYGYVQQLYDYVKLKKVKVRFISNVKPMDTIQTTAITNSASYDFNTMPSTDPVLTYIDYDGWQPMTKVGASGQISSPTNGDMTQFIQNKAGVRRHRMFGSVKRTFYPKQINLIAGDSSSGPTTSANLVQGKRLGWMLNGSSNVWSGNLIMAIPYVAQPDAGSGNVNYQPKFNWSISNLWYISFKAPLYG